MGCEITGAKVGSKNAGFECVTAQDQHGQRSLGPSGRYEGIKETAFDYAFLLQALSS